MLLLLAGCVFWVGQPDLAPYPLTRADLLRAPATGGPRLPAGFASPTVRSVAPEPMRVEMDAAGYPALVEVGGQGLPPAFTDALRGAAGGVDVGIPVEVVVERFQYLCLDRGRGRVDAGAYMVVEGAVRFGEGPWQPVEVTRRSDTCGAPEALYAEAGEALAGELGRVAATAPRGGTPRTLPAATGPYTLCVARDARPRAERVERRPAEVFSIYTAGFGYTDLRGSRVNGAFFAGDAAVTRASEALTEALARALGDVLPGLTVGEEVCPEEPYARVATPTVWARLDHTWVTQYVRSSAWSSVLLEGPVTITVGDEDEATTEAFAYWRAGIALCVEDVCRGTTVAANNDVDGRLFGDLGPRSGWKALSEQALRRLAREARDVVEGWRH